MATSGMYHGSVASAPRVVALPQQKKIMDDVLECIIQLKSEFFENHQPINDDNISLQRLCAKLEHLIQMGMRGKTSLLGRKKDYWDYFCDCLGSAKGSNDGIRYVKNLRENKTSLGRGRAFIRFCLVHQMLADAFQQCLVHSEKTSLWFMPSSMLCNKKDSNTLISALYDLNSMHFDLSPRGYDLDSDWPSFANRKMTPGGSWNIPISRRSSITSMDTISQASLSLATSPEVDRFHKNMEAAHSAHSDAQEQLEALQKEKEEVSQSAWESQGKVVALQEQLNTSQAQHTSLQERYRELDVNFVKMKLEKDHLEKVLSGERKISEEQESKRVQQLQGEEEVWKRERREEGDRRRKEIDKLQVDLRTKTDGEENCKRMIEQYCDSLVRLMSDCKMEVSSQDFMSNIETLRTSMGDLQTQLDALSSEKDSHESQASRTGSDNKRLNEELEKQHQDLSRVNENMEALNNQIKSLESKLHEKCQECDSLIARNLLSEKGDENKREEIGSLKELNQELKDKEKTLKELNQTLKERIISEHSKKFPSASKFDFEKYLNSIFERDDQVLELQQQMLIVEREITSRLKCNGEQGEDGNAGITAIDSMKKLKADVNAVLKEREEKLRLMLSDLQASEMKSGKFEKEVDMLGHGGQVLNEQLSLSEARVEFLSTKLKNEETKFVEMTKKQEDVLKELLVVENGKEHVEKERNELKSRVEELSAQINSSSCENKELKKQFKDVEVERQCLQDTLGSLKIDIEEKKKDLCNEREKIAILVKDSDGEKDSKAEILEKMSKLQDEKEVVRREKEDLTLRFEKENRELKENLETVQIEQQKLMSDIDSMKVNADEGLEKTKSEVAEIERENFENLEQLNNTIVQALKKCEHSLKLKSQGSDVEDIETTESKSLVDYNVKHNQLKTNVNSNVKTLCDRLKDLCDSHEKMEEITTNQLSAVLEEEKEKLLSEVDAALEETHHIKSQLEQTSELLTVSNSSLDTISTEKESLQSKVSSMLEEISRHEADREELESKMAVMVEEISRHEGEKDELRREMGILKSDCIKAEDDAQEKLREKRELEMKVEEIEEKLEDALSEKLKLEKAAEGLYSQSEFSHKVLEESLTDVQSALEAMKAEKMELEDKCSCLETEKSDLQERLQSSSDACQALKTARAGCDVDEEVVTLKKELEEEKAKYELEIDTLNSEISSLQFQMSSAFIEEQEELQTEYPATGTQSTVDELEAEIKQLEEENEKLKKQKEEAEEGSQDKTEHNKFVLKIDSLENQLKSYEKTLIEMQSIAEEAESSKEEMSLELTQLQLSAKKRIEDRDKELEILKSDNEGMKKQLLKLIKDKDSLWHKTDALVDEKKRKDNNKWVDNAKVIKCLLCKAEFSLFLRKHHCRLCGKIFCWACSDNWLDTAHSSKKARVCKTCFDRKTNPDSSLLGTSLIDNESDNDDDESNVSTTSSYIHTFNEAGNVEIREVLPCGATQRLGKNGDDDQTNETDEGKLMQSQRRSPSIDTRNSGNGRSTSFTSSTRSRHHPYEMETDSMEDSIYNATAEIRVNVPSANAGSASAEAEDDFDDSVYQVITQAEVAKTISDYNTTSSPSLPAQTNMTSSMLLSADELETGEVNRQNEVWIRPGRQFGVPIKIESVGDGNALSWEFTSQPKDIVFSIKFCLADSNSLSEAEEIVAPCKCDAHKQRHRGELTPKRPGIYTLIFDNTYSRMTSKKVHYHLLYQKSS